MMRTLHYCENIQSEIALNGISTKKKIYFDLNLQDENNLVIKITDPKDPFYYFFTSINDIELQHLKINKKIPTNLHQYFIDIVDFMKLCLNDDSNATETCTVLQIIPSDDENNVMLRIVQLKSSNVVTSILLRKPTDIEIKRHVLERYQQLEIQVHELRQSPDEQTENQGIETENVQISQTTAPPTATTIHDRNDHDIDRIIKYVIGVVDTIGLSVIGAMIVGRITNTIGANTATITSCATGCILLLINWKPMATIDADNRREIARLPSRPIPLEDRYGPPANFVEIETNLPVFHLKECSVRRRYSDFEWLHRELERDSKIVVPSLSSTCISSS
ncbi:unnamed protein product [Rotaria magnacalcarata]|uniref:Sorting nexin-3 n=5 Tax=Rotaria TaxID=231623 RepID=A0A816XPV4_9BILA|nr:unnamed protein product [Rotaria magnacalcarata]